MTDTPILKQEASGMHEERRAEPEQQVTHSVEPQIATETLKKTPEKILASVIVNAYNEESEIPRLMESLKRSWFPGIEVIISDDGSTDRTASIVKKYEEEDPGDKPADWLILDSHEKVGISAAKNFGAARAQGDYLFFFDADAPIPLGILEEDLRQMNERGLDIATHVLTPQFKLQKYSTALKNKITIDTINRIHGTSAIAGCGGILIKRDVFEQIGGFRKMPIGEDTDIWKRVMEIPGAHVGIIESVKMPVNMRRFEKQGHARTFLKWFRAWLSFVINERGREHRLVLYGPARRKPPISQEGLGDS